MRLFWPEPFDPKSATASRPPAPSHTLSPTASEHFLLQHGQMIGRRRSARVAGDDEPRAEQPKKRPANENSAHRKRRRSAKADENENENAGAEKGDAKEPRPDGARDPGTAPNLILTCHRPFAALFSHDDLYSRGTETHPAVAVAHEPPRDAGQESARAEDAVEPAQGSSACVAQKLVAHRCKRRK